MRTDKRLIDEPLSERYERRCELRDYVANNLDWLDGMTLSKHLRQVLLDDLPAVFGDRSFYQYLHDLLSKRRYKCFLSTLERIVKSCEDRLRYDYANYLLDTRKTLAQIDQYRPVRLGSMEGTNSKVYASRLKVWGCAWSGRGAIAMMRIRATIASEQELVAPGYDPWLTKKEKQRIEQSRHFSYTVAKSEGSGYEPPSGTVVLTTHMTSKMSGLLYGGAKHIPAYT